MFGIKRMKAVVDDHSDDISDMSMKVFRDSVEVKRMSGEVEHLKKAYLDLQEAHESLHSAFKSKHAAEINLLNSKADGLRDVFNKWRREYDAKPNLVECAECGCMVVETRCRRGDPKKTPPSLIEVVMAAITEDVFRDPLCKRCFNERKAKAGKGKKVK